MHAKRFFFGSLGILAIAIAYHLGAMYVQAQGGGTVAVIGQDGAIPPRTYIITAEGDVWYSVQNFGPSYPGHVPWTFGGNIFAGGPTPTKSTSWGEVKGKTGK